MNADIELLAQQLERHPDYKVLRRLKPNTIFNAELSSNNLCRGVVLDTETTGMDSASDKVIELGMKKHVAAAEEIGEKAFKEYHIRKSLDQMKAAWES